MEEEVCVGEGVTEDFVAGGMEEEARLLDGRGLQRLELDASRFLFTMPS